MTDFNEVIDRHHTFCTQWDYVEDRFHEKGLLPFTISDMDIACPKDLQNVLLDRLQHPILGYSRWKHHEFRGGIVSWYQKRFACDVQEDWIYYSPSVMYTISKCIEMYSNKGDGVLLLAPSYNAFYDVIKNNDRHIEECLFLLKDGHYEIDFDAFEEACQKVKIFILCNPHNPIGKVFTAIELEKIIAICERHHVDIISDDIHMDIDYHHRMTPILKLSTGKNIRIVIATSISKTFNVPALSGSYVMFPKMEDAQEFERITRYRDFVNSPAILHILATITAYEQCDVWVDGLLKHLQQNLCICKTYLEEHIPELTMQMPDSCYFAWINFEQLHITSEEFQDVLIHTGKVAIMPGATYGRGGESYLRFHVGCSTEKMMDGLHRLKKSVEEIKARK